MLQGKPNSQLSGSSCPCAPGGSQLHAGSSPSLVKKAGESPGEQDKHKWSEEQGRAGHSQLPRVHRVVAVDFADSQDTWVCLIELLLISRHSPRGGRRKAPRGFGEAAVAPERALETVWDGSRCSLRYQNFRPTNLFAAN